MRKSTKFILKYWSAIAVYLLSVALFGQFWTVNPNQSISAFIVAFALSLSIYRAGGYMQGYETEKLNESKTKTNA